MQFYIFYILILIIFLFKIPVNKRKTPIYGVSFNGAGSGGRTRFFYSFFSLLSRVLIDIAATLDALQKLAKWPDAIIIDDFHLCSDHQAARALPFIRARVPMSTSFIILSRNPPPEILDEQLIKGKIKQITNLQFTSDEIVLLFNKNKIPILKLDAKLLRKQTDGWAAALAAIMIAQTDSFSSVFNRETLNQYLKSYVFEYRHDFQVLKKCSVCETLNPNLCEVITGKDDAWEVRSPLRNSLCPFL